MVALVIEQLVPVEFHEYRNVSSPLLRHGESDCAKPAALDFRPLLVERGAEGGNFCIARGSPQPRAEIEMVSLATTVSAFHLATLIPHLPRFGRRRNGLYAASTDRSILPESIRGQFAWTSGARSQSALISQPPIPLGVLPNCGDLCEQRRYAMAWRRVEQLSRRKAWYVVRVKTQAAVETLSHHDLPRLCGGLRRWRVQSLPHIPRTTAACMEGLEH